MHIRCRDKDMEDDGTRDCKVGSIASWEKSMWLRAIYHARERSCLVVLRDGCCDNDDSTFESIPVLYIGGCATVIREAEVAACRSSFERAQLLGRALQ